MNFNITLFIKPKTMDYYDKIWIKFSGILKKLYTFVQSNPDWLNNKVKNILYG